MTVTEKETKERVLAEAASKANALIEAASNTEEPVAAALVIFYTENGKNRDIGFGAKSSGKITPILLSLRLLDFVRERVKNLPAYLQNRAHKALLKYFASGAPEPGFWEKVKSRFK